MSSPGTTNTPARRPATGPAPAPRRRDLRRLAEYLHLGKAALVLTSAALGFVAHQLPDVWDSHVEPPPSAVITSPAAMAVPHELALFGTYSTLPPGTLVWAVTQDNGSLRFYPQDRPCTVTDDQFNCGNYYLGPDGPGTGGGMFTIKIVAASAAAVNSFIQYQLDKGGPAAANNPGLSTLPAGTTLLTEKQVVRT